MLKKRMRILEKMITLILPSLIFLERKKSAINVLLWTTFWVLLKNNSVFPVSNISYDNPRKLHYNVPVIYPEKAVWKPILCQRQMYIIPVHVDLSSLFLSYQVFLEEITLGKFFAIFQKIVLPSKHTTP